MSNIPLGEATKITNRGILIKLVCGDIIDGQNDLDVPLLRLRHQSGDLLRSSLIKERVADLE